MRKAGADALPRGWFIHSVKDPARKGGPSSGAQEGDEVKGWGA